jgi:hypothetical protein
MEWYQLGKQKTRIPTAKEIAQLTAFIPKLCAPGFQAIREWGGGQPDERGVRQFPYPIYEPVVEEFFLLASQEQWCDYNYIAIKAAEMLKQENFIEHFSLDHIKSMLTFSARGECFCDGYWGTMIEEGFFCRILTRLQILTDLK